MMLPVAVSRIVVRVEKAASAYECPVLENGYRRAATPAARRRLPCESWRGRRRVPVRTGVECPSLSPDNTTLVYKDLKHDWGFWQLRACDLETGEDIAFMSETRSVDDQVDWFDNDHVLYHITGQRGADVIVLNTNGMEPPRTLREYSYSPAVVRR